MARICAMALGAGMLAATLTAAPASAAENIVVDGASPYAAESTTIFWGLSGTRHSWFAGGGFVHALNGNLGVNGWLVSGVLGGGSSEDFDVIFSETDSFQAAALIGYQAVSSAIYLAVYIGVNYFNNDSTPFDPTDPTAGDEVGFMVQGELETVGEDALYLSLMGTYSTAFDTYWVRARPGYNAGGIAFGPEFIASGDLGGDTVRYGAFVGGIMIGGVEMTISAGYQDERGATYSDGAYGAVEFSANL